MEKTLLTLLLLATLVSCNPTPAERLEMERNTQDSLARVAEQFRLDSIRMATIADSIAALPPVLVDSIVQESFDDVQETMELTDSVSEATPNVLSDSLIIQ